jgi:hypothetical protein
LQAWRRSLAQLLAALIIRTPGLSPERPSAGGCLRCSRPA